MPKTFDSSYFKGKDHLEEDYLVFKPMNKYFNKIGNTENISEWKSKGLPDEVIKALNNSLASTVKYSGKKVYAKFNGSCLKQDKITFNHGKTVNIYIVYDLKSNLNNFDPTLQNCLFGAIKLTKNNDIDKYKYFGYRIGFDSKGTFTYPSGGFGENVIVFGADMTSSVHANNKAKNILILGEGFTQGLEDTTLYAGKIYSTNFTATKEKFCLSLHYTNYKCRKRIVGELVEECGKNIDENEMIYNETLNDYKKTVRFLYNIHSIICHIFSNKLNHYQCFYLYPLVFKR